MTVFKIIGQVDFTHLRSKYIEARSALFLHKRNLIVAFLLIIVYHILYRAIREIFFGYSTYLFFSAVDFHI